MFWLLERAANQLQAASVSIELGGVRWVLNGYDRLPGDSDVPEYICISYAWGSGRVAHPLNSDLEVSDRTVPVIETVIAALQPAALWVDSLCVPAVEPGRAACLRQLGAIYAAAARVVAVLSERCGAALATIRAGRDLGADALPALESDAWVRRAWTYQEIVNSRSTAFLAEGHGQQPVRADELLQAVGYAIANCKKSEAIGAAEFRARYPGVDGLEDTLADYMIASPSDRFAYQVVAAMAGRFSEREADKLHASIGTIGLEPAQSRVSPDTGQTPLEAFLRACETRGDYSFDFLHWWLAGEGVAADSGELASPLLQSLIRIGFSGCGQHVLTTQGYFFPLKGPVGERFEVFVPVGVRWVPGAPGLTLLPAAADAAADADVYEFGGTGVFVGQVPRSGESIRLI